MKQIILATIMLVAFPFSSKAFEDFNFISEKLYYKITSNSEPYTVAVVNNNSITGTVNIPSSVFYDNKTYSVTSIGGFAFSGSLMTSVTIPNTVTSIGQNAFEKCPNLTSVTIPESVTSIEHDAFSNSSKLESVVIPKSIKSISESCFQNCSNLKSVTIPNSVTKIGEYAFAFCSNLTYVSIPKTVSSIGEFAFRETSSDVTGAVICCQIAEADKPSGWNTYCFSYCKAELKWGCKVVSLSANDDSFGTVSCIVGGDIKSDNVGDGGVYPTSIINITATPNTGCRFVKWSDGSTTNPRNIILTSDVTLTAVFEISTYTISFSCENGSVSGAGTYNEGTSVEISATPNTGYHFVKWKDGVKTATRTIKVTSNITLTAIFEINSYTVKLSSDENGSVSGAGTYKHNDPITISATPIENYHFVKWSDDNTDNPRAFNVTEDIDLKAIFAIDTYTVKLSSDENGSVSGAGTYDHGASATISATPNTGYHFVKWSDGNTTATRTIKVLSNINLTAEFAINTYTVKLSSDENGSVSGAGTYNHGDPATISATPNENYHFVKWSDGITTATRTINVTSDIILAAEFAINKYKVKLLGENGKLSGAGTYDHGTSVTISATPNTGYHFTKWNDGNETATRTINVTSNIALTAEFAINTYTVKLSSDENGSVSGVGTYNHGDPATISATPNENYHFVKWSDGITTATRTFNVTSDITLTAEFAINKYKVKLLGENGKLSGAGTYDHGTSVTISATPNTGYHFTKWNDGNETATRTINVTSNITLTAEFAVNTYTVELSCGNGTVEGAGTYEHGAETTLIATPNENYNFVGWSDGNTDNPRTVTVTEDLTLEANFEMATAISFDATNAVNIYAHHNVIVVENADADIMIYDVTGRLVARSDAASNVSVTMPHRGFYIVKCGAETKRVYLRF